MDQWKTTEADLPSSNPIPEQRHRQEVEVKDPVAARKVQKADREKLRRDRLNEQFLELGNILDPDRPKNDKATILIDTSQMLKDLTAEVSRLKAEYATLSEESRELMQEKNELREEKASLKSEIENLNVQYEQRIRVMFPWGVVDPSVVMGTTYPYPVPLPIASGPIPMHPSLQPFPFFGNQNPSSIPGPCSTFIPYPTSANPPNDQQSVQRGSSSHISTKQDSKSKLSDHPRGSNIEECDDSNDVVTELALKMPGSSVQKDTLTGERKGKQLQRQEKDMTNDRSSSRYSSPHSIQNSSSNSVGDVAKPKN